MKQIIEVKHEIEYYDDACSDNCEGYDIVTVCRLFKEPTPYLEDGFYKRCPACIEATEKSIQELYVKCPVCDGYGYTAEHSGHPVNEPCDYCPIQVQCDNCKATGFILTTTKEKE